MTIRKSLTAFIVTGLIMGVTSGEGRAMIQEEEEMNKTANLVHAMHHTDPDGFLSLCENNIYNQALRDIDFFTIVKTVDTFPDLRETNDEPLRLIIEKIKYEIKSGQTRSSEHYSSNVYHSLETIERNINNITTKHTIFFKHLINKIMRYL